MKSLICAAIGTALAILGSPTLATPVSVYKLVVDSCAVRSSDPYGPIGSGCDATTLNALGSTTLMIDSGVASYEYIQSHSGGVESVSISNGGFAEIDVPSGPGMGRLYPTHPGEFLCAVDCDLKISASVAGPSLLDVMLSVRTGTDELVFSGNGGYVASDFLALGGDFTGRFELVDGRSIPEPPTLPLAAIACAVAVGFAKGRA